MKATEKLWTEFSHIIIPLMIGVCLFSLLAVLFGERIRQWIRDSLGMNRRRDVSSKRQSATNSQRAADSLPNRAQPPKAERQAPLAAHKEPQDDSHYMPKS